MIPPFDKNSVLPPYLEGHEPSDLKAQSPYKSDIVEFCRYFATSFQRVEILKGYVQFRLDSLKYGITQGVQWIDGSFVENIEVIDNRDPRDIDVLTFIIFTSKAEELRIKTAFPSFGDHNLSKRNYHVDHFPLVLNYHPMLIVNYTKYWCNLFNHNRQGVWKGMIEIPLYSDPLMDIQALDFLNNVRV